MDAEPLKGRVVSRSDVEAALRRHYIKLTHYLEMLDVDLPAQAV
jgi:hypothetical protein